MPRYKERQLIKLAVWSKGVLLPADHSLIRNCSATGIRLPPVLMEALDAATPRIVAQFAYSGACIDLGSMSGTCELCGAALRYEYGLRNGVTGRDYMVGSECIVNYVSASVRGRLETDKQVAMASRRRTYHKALINAAWKATAEGDRIREFVKSVEEGYERYGGLTDKQVIALERVVQARGGELP